MGKEHSSEFCFRHLIGVEEDRYRRAEGLGFPNIFVICVILIRVIQKGRVAEVAGRAFTESFGLDKFQTLI